LNYYFVGPDNGIFSLTFNLDEIQECINIQNENFFHKPVSNTFHGRDIMAPVGAHISKNIPLETFGTAINPKNLITYPIQYKVSLKYNTLDCIIQYIDEFGNVVTNIPIVNDKIEGTEKELHENMLLEFKFKNNEYKAYFKSQYKTNSIDEFILIEGSTGYLEISLNQESAAEKLKMSVGDSLRFKI
jgi:S-adenosylmethionine hydrolase